MTTSEENPKQADWLEIERDLKDNSPGRYIIAFMDKRAGDRFQEFARIGGRFVRLTIADQPLGEEQLVVSTSPLTAKEEIPFGMLLAERIGFRNMVFRTFKHGSPNRDRRVSTNPPGGNSLTLRKNPADKDWGAALEFLIKRGATPHPFRADGMIMCPYQLGIGRLSIKGLKHGLRYWGVADTQFLNGVPFITMNEQP
jgi:hypothetical protein